MFAPVGRAASEVVTCLTRRRRKPRKFFENFSRVCDRALQTILSSPTMPQRNDEARMSNDEGSGKPEAHDHADETNKIAARWIRFRVSFRSARASSRRFGKWRPDLKAMRGRIALQSTACEISLLSFH
jgi:hypothetical protein